jgi:hypothetical protein
LSSWFKYSSFEEFKSDVEGKKEKQMIELLENFAISSSLKTNKKSLPYQHSRSITNTFSSYVNAIFFTERLNKLFIADLITKNASKIRFYIDIQLAPSKKEGFYKGIVYTIHYYIHPDRVY